MNFTAAKYPKSPQQHFLFFLLIVGILFVSACSSDSVTPLEAVEDTDCAPISYNTDIARIITANCGGSSCHGQDGRFGDFTTYAKLKPQLDNGVFERKVLVTKSMPVGRRLSSADFEAVKCWVAQGYPETPTP